MKRKIIMFSFLGGVLGSWIFNYVSNRWSMYGDLLFSGDLMTERAVQDEYAQVPDGSATEGTTSVTTDTAFIRFIGNSNKRPLQRHSLDLRLAAEKSKESVVFIRNLKKNQYERKDLFDWFFGGTNRTQVSSGSGVIFTKNGYIVTNHHVIKAADRIEVVHKKNTYTAILVGSDPSTDLAVIKVNARALPAVRLGSSEILQIGEWVLAVGNPFNLTSTVTAGIVSAKGRNINILRDKFPIESFIQTDAAINPGNSGGALVNATGELVGINTAILSQTGSYSGYSFAVPVELVRKVVGEIIKYGEVQRAFTGMELVDIDSKVAERLALSSLEGILVAEVQAQGAASIAGLRAGDIILEVHGKKGLNKADLEAWVGHARPGDTLSLLVKRQSQRLRLKVLLLNKEGDTKILKRNIYHLKKWGVELEGISSVEKTHYGITHGVKIIKAHTRFFKSFPVHFIIMHINKIAIFSAKDVENVFKNARGDVIFEGITEDGQRIAIRGKMS